MKPLLPARISQKGFIDPLSLVALGFLVISLFVGTAVVSNRNTSFNIAEKAGSSDDKEACEAKGCPWIYKNGSCRKSENACKTEVPTPKPTGTGAYTPPSSNGICPGTCVRKGSCADQKLYNHAGACVSGGICCTSYLEKPVEKNEEESVAATCTAFEQTDCDYGCNPATGKCHPGPITPSESQSTSVTTSQRLAILRQDCLIDGGKWVNNTCQIPDSEKDTSSDPEPLSINTSQRIAILRQDCRIDGGTWTNNTCKMPETEEAVSSNTQPTTVNTSQRLAILRQDCLADGGKWVNNKCEMPKVENNLPVVSDSQSPTNSNSTSIPINRAATILKSECLHDGGKWVNNACQLSRTTINPPSTSNQEEIIESQINRNLLTTRIKECFLEGGSWNGTSCSRPNGQNLALPLVTEVKDVCTPQEYLSCPNGCNPETGSCRGVSTLPTTTSQNNLQNPISGTKTDNQCEEAGNVCVSRSICSGNDGSASSLSGCSGGEVCCSFSTTQVKKENGELCSSLNSPSSVCKNGYCKNFRCTSPPAETVSGTEQDGSIYFSQRDPQWADLQMPGAEIAREFWQSGCGQTVAAMLISTYTNSNVNPYQLAQQQYLSLTTGDGTSFQENMDVLENYGFQSEQYRGSLYNLGNYITNNQQPSNERVAWINASFSSGNEGTRHHSLITNAEINASGQLVSLTLNDPYFGPNITCEVSSSTTFSCTGTGDLTLTVENIGVILIDPPQI